MIKTILGISLLGIVITSCGDGGASERAKEMCACMEDADVKINGIHAPIEYTELSRNVKEDKKSDWSKCYSKVLKSMQEDMDDMNDKDKAAYLREYSKAFMDTECGAKSSEEINFDNFEKSLELFIKQAEGQIDIGDRAYDDY